jgi:hypothetical protein
VPGGNGRYGAQRDVAASFERTHAPARKAGAIPSGNWKRCGRPGGGSDEVIMSIAGHVSRYSQVRMEAKRRALDKVAVRSARPDDKRGKEAEPQLQNVTLTSSTAVQ